MKSRQAAQDCQLRPQHVALAAGGQYAPGGLLGQAMAFVGKQAGHGGSYGC